jgi:hypothetical protein
MAIVSGVSCNSKKIKMRQFTTIIATITLLLLTGFSVVKSENVEKNLNVIDSLKQDYVSRMNGVWVMTDYIVDIQKNKSPLKSFGLLNGKGVVELSINGLLNRDTVLCSAVINNHEELEFTGCPKRNENSVLTINLVDYYTDCHYEIGLDTTKNKISIVLYRLNLENKLIEKRYFTKVLEHYDITNKIEGGITRVVNETLLAGKYRLVNEKGNESNVIFDRDGSITGFESFKSYYISTDFLLSPTQSFDQIFLQRKDGKHQGFGITLKEDSVYLNQIKGNDEKFETLKLGKIKYILTKK